MHPRRNAVAPIGETGLGLLALVLAALLLVVAPAGIGVGVDSHRGEALHPLFLHSHPPAADDGGLRASAAQPNIQSAQSIQPTGPAALVGQVLTPIVAARGALTIEKLATSQSRPPSGLRSAPPDPPPTLA